MPFPSTPTSGRDATGRAGSSGEFILPELGGKLVNYADKEGARARGPNFLENKKLQSRGRVVELTNGEKIISSTLIWTAGTP